MPSLASTLKQTAPASVLRRKARRLGLHSLSDAIALAVARGCKHYAPVVKKAPLQISRQDLPDDELTILLICGEQEYDPMSIRCAAQLARSRYNQPQRMAQLAIQEKAERTLSHIARCGVEHDTHGKAFWQELIMRLPPQSTLDEEAVFPHWTRFVSMPGIHRGKTLPTQWLVPIHEFA